MNNMSSDKSSDDGSPVIKKRKYKLYKKNPDKQVPLRTLDRWAAKKRRRADRPSTFALEEESNVNYESSCSAEENSDDSSRDKRQNSHDNCNEDNLDAQISYDDSYVNTISDFEINDFEDQEICNENNMLIQNIDNDTTPNILIHENSTVTVDQSVFNLLDFYIQHKLSKSALKNALKIQLAILPSENKMPKTVFKLLQYVENLAPRNEVRKHYYCKNCLFYLGIEVKNNSNCSSCSVDEKNFSFFFEFNIEDQLKYLFENNNLANKLKLSPPRCDDSNIISNITDGTEYIRVNSREDRGKYDLTLILNTDGLSLVKSASSHCWPLMYTIAELPENIRESYIIILGLWYDSECKPNMNTFLQPFCTRLKDLHQKGFKWIHPHTNEEFISRVVAPLFIADAPARATLQNILSYNGTYGCNICEIMTEKCKPIAGKKNTRMYPFKKNDSPLRTSTRMIRQAEMREIFAKAHCRGVKGHSILASLPLLDLGSCVLPEYMHSVLLGVVKQYANLILDKPGPWNIRKKRDEINLFMKNIEPPQSFNRLPRPITDFKYYKASEFYNWILFYSLPSLISFLPDKYMQHLMLLVMALYNLLQDQILIQPELERSENFLDLFVEQIPLLYSDREMTYNSHQLKHLGLCVRRWGPLRSTSAFPWENQNGYIAQSVHGTKNIGQEIVNNLKIVQGVQMLKCKIEESNYSAEARELQNYSLLGNPIDYEVHENDRFLIISEGVLDGNLNIYARANIFQEVYTSTSYKTIKTNSYTIEMRSFDNSCLYGMIKFFFEKENELYFIIERLKVENNRFMIHSKMQATVKHILPIIESGESMLIKLSSVKSISQLVRVGNYVCKRPDKSKRIW